MHKSKKVLGKRPAKTRDARAQMENGQAAQADDEVSPPQSTSRPVASV